MERPRIIAPRVGKSRRVAIRRGGDNRMNPRKAMVTGRKPVPF
jgi:hypothetical protein